MAAAVDRLLGLVPPKGLILQTPPGLGEVLRQGEPRIPEQSLGVEPTPRDTGPAVALAMRRVLEKKPEAVVAVIPADQRVENLAAFRVAMTKAAEAARLGWLVVLGITPDHPSTRFGYVDMGPAIPSCPEGVLEVRRFIEKPDPRRAEEFFSAEHYLWNAGMFIWRADVFWDALSAANPEMATSVAHFVSSGEIGAWESTPRLSIDYALMERATHVAAVPLDAGWSDVGGWDAVLRLVEKNDAGDARFVGLKGEATSGSRVLVVGKTQVPAGVVLGAEPRLVIVGPEGILVAPPDGTDAVKKHVG